jgi:UDP-glucuronate 4-epimerase
MKKKILITGSAGFIGFHLAIFLLKKKFLVYGIDNYSNYYDVSLKKKRTSILKKYKNFKFYKFDLTNRVKLKNFFKLNKFKKIIHLAAQPGVRLSLRNRYVYFKNNIEAFYNMMELCVIENIKNFIYASSSSVYGDSTNFPIKENNNTDSPLSFYAATKKCNEIIASAYSKMCKTKFIGLRFFTVYGTLGRPDMALHKFTESIFSKRAIEIFNNGNHFRDFTYIDDVVNLIFKLIVNKKKLNHNHVLFNVSCGKAVKLKKYINLIEKHTNITAKKKYKKKQIGDVLKTFGDNKKILKFLNYKIKFDINIGLKKFISWFKKEHKY